MSSGIDSEQQVLFYNGEISLIHIIAYCTIQGIAFLKFYELCSTVYNI